MTTSSLLMMMLLLSNMIFPVSYNWSNIMFDMDTIFIMMKLSNMNMFFMKMISLIALLVLMWSLFYMPSHKSTIFFISLLMFVMSMLLLTVSDSMLSVFLGWEGLGITSFILIIFYQNWISMKGGLLTLLTNRLGDAVLLISLSGMFLMKMGELENNSSYILMFLLVFLTLTKSAQWPFISWLPAAMAAPTPVSSLVHSSTLVTAGVWLMIRFSFVTLFNVFVWGVLGLLTLMVASFSALMEVDSKKMVALSTLSQLGLMFIALALGMPSICFFHIIMHAFAKANLFMVVGGIIYSSFSQQDYRFIMSSSMNILMSLSMFISMLSLIGLVFMSGFYSKEQILMNHSFIFNSMISIMLIILIVGLTLSYCFKLMKTLLHLNSESVFQSFMVSLNQVLPIFLMSMLTVISGLVMSFNGHLCSLLLGSMEWVYWLILILGFVFFTFSNMFKSLFYTGFYSQIKMIDLMISTFNRGKIMSINMESSLSESMFLMSSFHLYSLLKQSMRVMLMLSLLNLTIFFY